MSLEIVDPAGSDAPVDADMEEEEKAEEEAVEENEKGTEALEADLFGEEAPIPEVPLLDEDSHHTHAWVL